MFLNWRLIDFEEFGVDATLVSTPRYRSRARVGRLVGWAVASQAGRTKCGRWIDDADRGELY
jgi:hypothetical protein